MLSSSIAHVRRLFDQHTGVRYVFVGGSSYAVELSSLLALYHLTGSRSLATAVSFLIGFCIAFGLQKLVAFREFSRELKAIGRQGTLYALLNAWNWVFTVAFVSILPADNLIVTRTIALVLMTSWNFFVYRYVIFRQR